MIRVSGQEQFSTNWSPEPEGERESVDPSCRTRRLGLALVKGIVELHGGDVSARSGGLGKGAKFIVRLPLAYNGPDGIAKRERAVEAGFARHLAKPPSLETLVRLLAEVE